MCHKAIIKSSMSDETDNAVKRRFTQGADHDTGEPKPKKIKTGN